MRAWSVVFSASAVLSVIGALASMPVEAKAAGTAGKCGSSNGAILQSAPTSNLCSIGVASSVNGSGPWTWTCFGSGGGANASCSATGPHKINLGMAEDYYQGNAQYSILVDGVQVATGSITALHSSGASQDIPVGLANGSHQIKVTFLNDAWGGSLSTDRNLYVNYLKYDGIDQSITPTTLWRTGDAFSATVPVTQPLVVVVAPSAPSVACTATAGSQAAALSVTGGNGSAVSWSLTAGDTTDFAMNGANLIVGTSGIASANCGKAVNTTVQASQTGASASATPTITIGAAAGAVPAQASVAGFNTLALNVDFSQSLYATQANWLDCANNDNTKTWHASGSGIISLTCNINQKSDPVTGEKVMNVHLGQNDSCVGKSDPFCQVRFSTQNAATNTVTWTIPQSFYFETVQRVERVFGGAAEGGPAGQFFWWVDPSVSAVEYDVVEQQLDGGGYANDGVINWKNGGSYTAWTTYSSSTNTRLPPGFVITNYHKFGMRVASDSSTISTCWYVDDISQGCALVPNVSADEILQRLYPIVQVQAPGGTATHIGDRDLDIKYMKLWSCSNWQTTNCGVSFAAGPDRLGGFAAFTNSNIAQSAATAPGGAAATRLTENTVTGYHTLGASGNLGQSSLSTFQVNIAPGSSGDRQVVLYMDDSAIAGGGYELATFDPATGAVSNVFGNGATNVKALASGGYKVSVSLASDQPIHVVVMELSAGGSDSYTGNGTSNVIVWNPTLTSGYGP